MKLRIYQYTTKEIPVFDDSTGNLIGYDECQTHTVICENEDEFDMLFDCETMFEVKQVGSISKESLAFFYNKYCL